MTVIEQAWMGRSFSADKAAEMERFAFIDGVAIISVVTTVLSNVSIGGFEVLRGGGMRSTRSALHSSVVWPLFLW